MFTISHDYYGILGVSKEATEEEIKSQYKKLMKEHHPDQYKGLRAKYVEMGDEDLLRVIDEKIRQAEEMSKLINEAFETLIDPIKRRQYDDQIYEPAVAKPEIAIHPTKLTFGTLTEGQRKVLFFTVENKGGPVTSVNIDWENTKPDWGELVIEPDPEATFPIKVAVKVDTTGIPSGPKYEKVQVAVDGEVHLVEVYLAVEAVQKVAAPAAGVPPSTPVSPAPKTGRAVPKGAIRVVGFGFLGLLVLLAIVSGVEQSGREADRSWAFSHPEESVSWTRVGQVEEGCWPYGKPCILGVYALTNNTDFQEITVDDPRNNYDCDVRPQNLWRVTVSPGETITLYCLEKGRWDWEEHWTEVVSCTQAYDFGSGRVYRTLCTND